MTLKYVWAPQNLAAFTLFGQVAGAAILGLLGALFGSGASAGVHFALWTAFAGAAAGGGIGMMIGVLLLRVDSADVVAHAHRRERASWWMIAVGAVSGVVVVTVSVAANFSTSGFLNGSPCFSERIETLVPLQYTCLNPGGAVALLLPQTIWLTLIALAGATVMVLGLVLMRRAPGKTSTERSDKLVMVFGWTIATFLALDATLGVLVVATPAG